jgi:hypothetical protein
MLQRVRLGMITATGPSSRLAVSGSARRVRGIKSARGGRHPLHHVHLTHITRGSWTVTTTAVADSGTVMLAAYSQRH